MLVVVTSFNKGVLRVEGGELRGGIAEKFIGLKGSESVYDEGSGVLWG